MSIVTERARAAVQQHGGVRKAARALNINPGVLSLLADGKRLTAGPRTLRALGVKRMLIVEHIAL
jgi:hypothetical protein